MIKIHGVAMTKTIDYYNQNADNFIVGTKDVGFSDIQNEFISFLPTGAKILDFGCGSGRDAKAFMEKGYKVIAVDGSVEICRIASEYLGTEVKQMLFDELDETDEYDGIWACASILHADYSELSNILQGIYRALKIKGVFYTSFKYGSFQGERNGRFFTDLDEASWDKLMEELPGFVNKKIWITGDARPGRENEKWLNVIAIKEK